jgi:DNA-binding transcriptional MocR family regulator
MDGDGVIPEALEEAVRRHAPKAIYLNPTLQNPKTITIPECRRAAICSLARRLQVPIVEDDAYGFIPTHGPPAPRSHRARHLLAYCRPRQMHRRWPAFGLCRRARRPSRVVVQQRNACALRHGVADLGGSRNAMDQRRHRRHDPAIHSIGKHRSRAHRCEGDGAGLVPLRSAELQNIWLPMRNGWTRSVFVSQARTSGLGVVPSDAFAANGAPPEAVRVGLGGPITRTQVERGLAFYRISSKGNPSPSRRS